MKRVAGRLRLDLAQYREVASFAELTADLDAATLRQLHRGERLAEVLKQPPHQPVPVSRQVCILWAAVNGHLDHIPLCDVSRFEKEWFELLGHAYPDVPRRIEKEGELTDEVVAGLTAAMQRFQTLFVTTRAPETMSRERVVPQADDQEERMSETIVRT
jgi:F-type H+-transporting ATPase subunit alpha